jgi:predicted nucleic acid-binding Zn ribbon protein
MSEDWDEVDFDNAHQMVNQRRRYSRKPKKTANLLSQLMARKGYGQQKSTNEIQEVWEKIATPLKDFTRTGAVRRGVLEIIVTSPAITQQLEFQKKQLLAELNRQLPQNKISEIRFRIGNVH